jgi:hypothetical protein
VQININTNVKAGITALATIGANGCKLPLFLIAKGKTTKCEEGQIGDLEGGHFITHTEKGWTTEESFLSFLEFFSQRTNQQPCALIIDCYKAHKTDAVKKRASELQI